MKPAAFKYMKASSLDEALEAKARFGTEASVLAGGQSLIPTMNFRMAQPKMLIDINGVAALQTITQTAEGAVEIGALVRHRAVERSELLQDTHPILCEAEREVAHPQIRNRGTLGGNLAHADPMSEMPAVMLALGARFKAQAVGAERWIEADRFFKGVFTTALGETELLTVIAVPALKPGTGCCFLELARRRGDYPMAGVAALVTIDANSRATDVRLAFCSAGDTPRAADGAAASLVGRVIDADAAKDAAAAAAKLLDPTDDAQAGADYKRHVAQVLARRAILTAAERARPRAAA